MHIRAVLRLVCRDRQIEKRNDGAHRVGSHRREEEGAVVRHGMLQRRSIARQRVVEDVMRCRNEPQKARAGLWHPRPQPVRKGPELGRIFVDRTIAHVVRRRSEEQYRVFVDSPLVTSGCGTRIRGAGPLPFGWADMGTQVSVLSVHHAQVSSMPPLE